VTHLRKMMLEELQRRNYAQTTTRSSTSAQSKILLDDSTPSGPLGSSAHSRISSGVVSEAEVVGGHCRDTPGGSAFFLHQDSQQGLEHRRNSLSEKGTSSADDPQPGRSRATHRRGSPSPHHRTC
jgi:hypothetical protein